MNFSLDINENYNQQWDDTTPLFQYFFNSSYPLRILIYNGDVDTACEFLGGKLLTVFILPLRGLIFYSKKKEDYVINMAEHNGYLVFHGVKFHFHVKFFFVFLKKNKE